MFVSSYKKVKESIDLHENSTTTSFFSQRSDKKKTFASEQFPGDIEIDSKKVYWSKSWGGGSYIPFSGIPFIIIGHEDFECHQGPDHKERSKRQPCIDLQDTDHCYSSTKRKHQIQTSKKKGCSARIKLKVVINFPQFQVENEPSEWNKRLTVQKLKNYNGQIEKESRFYLFFPEDEDHSGHLTGEFSGYVQPPAENIRNKIKELALLGIRRVGDIRVFLENYVVKELFPGFAVSRQNRRFFPGKKEIRNYIYSALRKTRFSLDDQQNLERLVKSLSEKSPMDSFFVRTMNQENDTISTTVEEVPTPQGFLFAHQSSWQKRLLNLYGQELCLLDATYCTSKYDLPLFFICVQTNTGYAICGSFITANESKDCIEEALGIIKGWNPEWHPTHFLTDFDEREISAVESVFPECLVYLCHFHIEQAWDRWLSNKDNGASNYKEEIKTMLSQLCNRGRFSSPC